MKSVGNLLKSAREKQQYTLVDVEKATRIRSSHLSALEEDQYDKLPSATYAKGFIKNYARFLDMSEKTLLAVFRRDFAEDSKGQIIPRGMIDPISTKTFWWTPRATLITIVTVFLTLFFSYLALQYKSFVQPTLEIVKPVEGELLMGPTITITGISDSSSVVSVNDQLVPVEQDGSFSTSLSVSSGRNELKIEASNTSGYTTVITRIVEVKIQ